jgi:hypothetical protein
MSLLRTCPASTLSSARNFVTGTLFGVASDYSTAPAAVRLTPVPGTNNSTWVAYEIFNDASSKKLDNWIQPQYIPQTSGSPSIGYAVRVFDGNPNSGGVEIPTTAGTTGSGVNKSVAWVWNYSNGLLFISSDFRSSITSGQIWIQGFRYVGQTVENLSVSGSGGDITASYLVVSGSPGTLTNYRRLVAGPGIQLVDDQSSHTLTVKVDPTYITRMMWNEIPMGFQDGNNQAYVLSQTPNPSTSLMFFVNGVLQRSGYNHDYYLSGSTVTLISGSIPVPRDNLLATYQY